MTTRAARTAAGIVAVALLAGCSSSTSEPTRTPTSSPSSPPQAAAYTGPNASYSYRLVSTCGERSGLGTFDVTVRHGSVAQVRPVDQWSRIQLVRKDIPTLDGFVAEAERARHQGADQVRLTMRSEHVDTLSIDWDTHAIDDEFCWHATHVRTT